jgi:hypothetical protein
MNGSPVVKMLEDVQNVNHIILIGEKKCRWCGKNKKISDFYKSSPNKCKSCVNLASKKWKENNRERFNELCKKSRIKNREQVLESGRKYYARNKEKRNVLSREWKKKNERKYKEYMYNYKKENKKEATIYNKEYYKNNIEKEKARAKKYKENNKNKISEILRKWHLANPNKKKEYSDKYYAYNKHKYMDNAKKRRAKLLNAEIEKFSAIEIYERDNWICGICKKPVDKNIKHPHPFSKSLDHIIPLYLGGSHSRDNVQLAHLRCNIKKGTKNDINTRTSKIAIN